MSYLGMDIGTTGSKAVVFNEQGDVLAASYREYQIVSPQPGWFELDPQSVMQACRQAIAEAAGMVKDKDPVAAIGVSSQGEAFTVLDMNDKYLCNAMVSFDVRSQEQVNKFTSAFGEEKLYRITGHSAHTLFSLFKVLWLKENRPDVFSKVKRLLCMGDLLSYELTGEAVISYNLAARTMMFDVRRLEWSEEILGVVKLDKRAVSRAAAAGYCIGTVRADSAAKLGLAKDVLVATGGHDQSCGALGVGAVSSGMAAYSIGTVECFTPAFGRCVLNETMRRSNLATYPHVINGLYTTVAFCITGGSGLRWFRDTLGKYEIEKASQTGADVYDLLLKDMPAEPSGLLVLPHFTSTGTPYFDPSPLGAILGVKLTTTKGDMLKCLLEGITFEMKLNLELLRKAGVSVDELRAFGGGTKSAAWMQIKADIFNMPIAMLAVTEAGCLGAAMLAAKASGYIKSLEECVKAWVKPVRHFEPDAKRGMRYGSLFEIYSDLYKTLMPISKRLKKLGE